MKNRTQVGENLRKLAVELDAQTDELERFIRVSLVDPKGASMPGFLYGIDRDAKKPFTEEICRHPGFIWLFRQPEFDAAFQYFERRTEENNPGKWRAVSLKMQFLYLFAGYGRQAFSDSIRLPRKISTSEKKRAVEIAIELLIFVKAGLGRPDSPMMESLEDPLTEFVEQMQIETKREYEGPTNQRKEILLRMARHIAMLGMKQRDVVRLVEAGSAVFGFDLSHRTMQRYVSEAFSQLLR